MSKKSRKYTHETKAVTPTLGKADLLFFCTDFYLIYLPTKFLVDTSSGFNVIARQRSKCTNEKTAIIQKLGKAYLLFFYIARLLNEIFLPTGFLADISCSFRHMDRRI
jgi:hypothetical protein